MSTSSSQASRKLPLESKDGELEAAVPVGAFPQRHEGRGVDEQAALIKESRSNHGPVTDQMIQRVLQRTSNRPRWSHEMTDRKSGLRVRREQCLAFLPLVAFLVVCSGGLIAGVVCGLAGLCSQGGTTKSSNIFQHTSHNYSAFAEPVTQLVQITTGTTIPSQIALFTQLSTLSLANYQLKGTIPSGLAVLVRLQEVNLSNNSLTGTIPTRLGQMKTLNLALNYLNGTIPQTLGWIPARQNQPQSRQTSLSNENTRSRLQELSLNGNRFTGVIPTTFGLLRNLKVLSLQDNNLTGTVPNVVCQLPALLFLNVDREKVQCCCCVPNSNNTVQPGKCAPEMNVTIVPTPSSAPVVLIPTNQPSPYGTPTSPTTPPSTSKPSSPNTPSPTTPPPTPKPSYATQNPTSISPSNETTASPTTNSTTLANSTSQQEKPVRLFGQDYFPSQVTELDLTDRNLTGTIPTDLRFMTKLNHLFLSKNQLTGPIPAELGQMMGLAQLKLDTNRLSGPIPQQLGFLTNLTALWLQDNELTGALPEGICHLSSRLPPDSVRMDTEEVADCAPGVNSSSSAPSYAPTTNATSSASTITIWGLEIGRNETNVSFPDANLSGPIPTQLGLLSLLTLLKVPDNSLTGTLPEEMSFLTLLQYLDLGGNALIGTIPLWLGTLTALSNLDFGSNKLLGSIPGDIGAFTQMTKLHLGGNFLSGTIPSQLTNMTALQDLQLGNNQHMSGTIPSTLGALTSLTRLSLEKNRLTGTIPSNVGLLTGLIELRLQNNSLTGTVPESICLLHVNFALEYVGVSGQYVTCPSNCCCKEEGCA